MNILISPAALVRAKLPPVTTWQQAMKEAVRDPSELCRLVGLPSDAACPAAARDFSVFAPHSYIARMRWGDPHDPLLLQVLPHRDEQESPQGFFADPVGDAGATRAPGLLHKYHGRVLLITTGACAVHCRYCFRRHFPYHESPRSVEAWEPQLLEMESDTTIREAILSGGDPLTLTDEHLAEWTTRLAQIKHLQRLRIHTRLPIMIPERVTDVLIDTLRGSRLTPIVVIHANHAQELDESVAQSLSRLVDAGIPLLNQSVLLAGVNDSVQVLADLSERLIALRVMPYYLHQLDRVTGAAHFEVSIERGREIMAQLREQLPGYAVPRYVQEVSGAPYKRPLD